MGLAGMTDKKAQGSGPMAWGLCALLLGLQAVAALAEDKPPPPLSAPVEVGGVEAKLPPPETRDPNAPVWPPPVPPKAGDCKVGNTTTPDGRRVMVLLCLDNAGQWRMQGELK